MIENLKLEVLQTTTIKDFSDSLRNSNCKACSLSLDYINNKPVVARGSPEAPIMFIGEA